MSRAVIGTFSGDDARLTTVIDVPIPAISKDQILIKSVAFAGNPTDWKGFQRKGAKFSNKFIVGCDVSGVVEAVGDDVIGYAKGDVVSSFVQGNYCTTRGGYARYAVLRPGSTIKYDGGFQKEPLSVGSHEPSLIDSFEAAAASTTALATTALTFSHSLKISDVQKGDTILIWGGATATGIYAIQAAQMVHGLRVITTASARNHGLLRSLGDVTVFDYNEPDVVGKIKEAGEGRIRWGLDAVSTKETWQQTYDATEGAGLVGLDNLLHLTEEDIRLNPSRKVYYGKTILYQAEGYGVGHKMDVDPQLIKDYDHYWQKVLPEHIGKMKTPVLRVLQPGLESANEALALLKGNKVSGEKVVFRYE